ncbi:MAG: class I SAM-dependent methyltransferase [Flavobacteriales bacterium]|nr:class I SAM-dependent methyltransferase [Flavobacteriales bacterium]
MKKVEIFADKRATNYDSFVETWIPNYHYFMSIVPSLIEGAKGDNLLVAGCGTGTEIKTILDASPSWKVTGVDPSKEMINQAKERFSRNNSVKLMEGVVSDLPNEPVFHAATLLLVLHFMPDDGTKLNLLKTISKRLHKHSPFVIFDITGSPDQMSENLEILRHLIPKGLPAEDINDRVERIKNNLFTVSEERIYELLIGAGFSKPVRFFQNSIYMGWRCYKS